MNSKPTDILPTLPRRDGTTTPEGYFADFASRMAAQLPQQEWERPQPTVLHRTVWQKIRPYVYMAAMFMGVWCMMKMVDLMRTGSTIDFDSNPVLAEAFDNSNFISDYIINEADISDFQLMDDLYTTGFNPTDDINPEFYDI